MWKQSKYPWTDDWMEKMWHMHTLKYYSAPKRKEMLHFATVWMKLEDIIPSEISQ